MRKAMAYLLVLVLLLWGGTVQAQVGARRAAVLSPNLGPAISEDFTTGALDPNIAFARTSPAWVVDVSGTLQQVGNGVPRFDHDPSVVDPNVPHNLIPRSQPTGGLPGVVSGGTVTGTMPTGWRVVFNPSSLLVTFNGTGTDADGDYAEFRALGTWGASANLQISSTFGFQVAAVSGQTFSTQQVVKFLTNTGVGQFVGSINENAVGPSFVTGGTVASFVSPPTNVALAARGSRTLSGGPTVAFIDAFPSVVGSNGSAVDTTYRIYQPQLNLGPQLTAYVATNGTAIQPSYVSLGLRIEEARTNSIRNGVLAGAAAGTPGTLPTNVTEATIDSGLTRSVVGAATEFGLSCFDVRYAGTAVGSTQNQLIFEGTTVIAAANGQSWTHSGFYRLMAGTLTNVTQPRLAISQRDGAGAFLAELASTGFTPGYGPVNQQRQTFSATLNNASVAFVQPKFYFTTAAGAVDFTLRICDEQLELGAFATSPILTSGAAVTRAAENASLAVPSSLTNPRGLTILMKARTALGGDASGPIQDILSLDNGTSTNRIQPRRLSSGNLDTALSAQGTSVFPASPYVAIPNNLDFAMFVNSAPGDISVEVVGQPVRTLATLPTVPGPLTVLNIGADNGGANRWNSTIAKVQVFPRRANDNEALQRASGL